MRVLFLDFDGILHPASIAFTEPGLTLAELVREKDTFRWAPVLADLLAPHPDVGLVVHSSWRSLASDFELRELLGPAGSRFSGSAPPGGRWDAIRWVLDDNPISDYRILDDAPLEFPIGHSRLIVCDPELGISDPAVQHALRAWLEGTP